MVVCLPGQPQSATAAPPLAVCFKQPLENTSTTHLHQIANDHTVPLNFFGGISLSEAIQHRFVVF